VGVNKRRKKKKKKKKKKKRKKKKKKSQAIYLVRQCAGMFYVVKTEMGAELDSGFGKL